LSVTGAPFPDTALRGHGIGERHFRPAGMLLTVPGAQGVADLAIRPAAPSRVRSVLSASRAAPLSEPRAAVQRLLSEAGWVAIVLAVVVLPIAVSLITMVGDEWYPGGDFALEVMQADEVGGSRTPLTGAWSRWGWDHPGPLLFWLFAPFTKLLGPIGILWGAALLNGVAMAGGLLVAMRRGGRSLAVLTALALVVLCSALGAGRLVDPWNPWAAVLPFFAFVLLAWAVGDRDVAMAPWLVAVGTFAVQAHVGYIVLVTGLGLTAGLIAWAGRRATPNVRDGPSPRAA
jgi:hypothetical protein